MSGLRHGRETVFKATQITDKLCLAWGQGMSRREVQEGQQEGCVATGVGLEPTYEEQGWIPPLQSKAEPSTSWVCGFAAPQPCGGAHPAHTLRMRRHRLGESS